MQLLEERAEDLEYNSLEQLTPLNELLNNMIHRYLFSDERIPWFLTGPKGGGKTIHVMKGLSEAIEQNEDFLPAMFIYRQRNILEALNPVRLAPKDIWGEKRYHILQSCLSLEDLMQSANVIVYDDVHYTFEGIANGMISEDELCIFLGNILDNIKKGKKAILISEGSPFHYAEKIGSKRLEDLFLQFGLFPKEYSHSNHEEWNEYTNKIDYRIHKEVPPLQYKNWLWLWENYNINAEDPVKDLLYYWASNPRTFVRFVKLFQPKTKITMEDLADKARQILPEKLHPRTKGRDLKFYEFLLDNFLTIESGVDLSSYKTMLDKVRKDTETIAKINQNFSTISRICKNSVVKLSPQPPLWANERRWRQDSFYALRKLKKEDPFVVSNMLNETISREVGEDRVEEMRYLVDLCYSHPILPRIVGQADLAISEIKEREKGILQDAEKIFHDTSKFTERLMRNLYKYFINSYQFTEKDYLILSKPFYDCFISQLYEAPTLEIITRKYQSDTQNSNPFFT